MIKFLQGKKTYIVATVGAIVVFLFQIHYIDIVTANTILAYLIPAGLVTLRAGQAKIEEQI